MNLQNILNGRRSQHVLLYRQTSAVNFFSLLSGVIRKMSSTNLLIALNVIMDNNFLVVKVVIKSWVINRLSRVRECQADSFRGAVDDIRTEKSETAVINANSSRNLRRISLVLFDYSNSNNELEKSPTLSRNVSEWNICYRFSSHAAKNSISVSFRRSKTNNCCLVIQSDWKLKLSSFLKVPSRQLLLLLFHYRNYISISQDDGRVSRDFECN